MRTRAHRAPLASALCAPGRNHPDPTAVTVTKPRAVQTSTVLIAERPSIDRPAMLRRIAAGLVLRPSGWLCTDHTRRPGWASQRAGAAAIQTPSGLPEGSARLSPLARSTSARTTCVRPAAESA